MKDSILITGGAGFIGINLADHYLSAGKRVAVLDDFSRRGSRDNAAWLRNHHGDRVTVIESDITKQDPALGRACEEAEVCFHLAAQVAVTTSVVEPRHDFETNALGTFNVLEAVRASSARPVVVYASTNKVYGKMDDIEVVENNGRWEYGNLPGGASEDRALDFHSPYGCSKGAGDQYVRDYSRIYGLETVVLRQSCIYGPHQFGIEDQGWVAWFSIRAMQGRSVVVYGDGKQIRDLLYVDDLIAAYDAAVDHIGTISGRAYNVGGGPDNTLSLRELIASLDKRFGRPLEHKFDEVRPGDQRVFVSDNSKAFNDFGWKPEVGVEEGLARLHGWIEDNKDLFPEPVTHPQTGKSGKSGENAETAETDQTAPLELSVVVAPTHDGGFLPGCLAALAAQLDSPMFEVIVPVDASIAGVAALRAAHPVVRFVDVAGTAKLAASDDIGTRHLAIDRRRSAGLRAARAPIVALTDEHARPEPGWCSALATAHEQPHAAIGGAVENAVDRALNWALYFCDAGRYQNPLPESQAEFVSDVNVSYKRDALNAVEDTWRETYEETGVHDALRARGERLWLSPTLVVRVDRGHVGLGYAMRERFAWARLYAGRRSRELSLARRLVLAAGSPLLGALFLARQGHIVFSRRANRAAFAGALPWLVLLNGTRALGECMGYLVPDAADS